MKKSTIVFILIVAILLDSYLLMWAAGTVELPDFSCITPPGND